MHTRFTPKRFLLFILIFVSSLNIFAAAGGGGGGHSGGGSGGDGGDGGAIIYLIYWLIRLILMLPFPINIIVLAIIIFFIYKASKSYQAVSGLNSIPNYNPSSGYNSANRQDKVAEDFLAKNPDFDKENFKAKVRTAFTEIQLAWMQQDLSKVRKWISDGVYQRFNTQFIMMKQIEQVNQISDIQIQQVFIDEVETDGVYDIVHVGIQYSMYDGFESKKYTQLNDGGPLQALDFWSFIKKSGVKEKDLYHTVNCPNCGGNLPEDGGETAKCPYCSTITYLGDYDWILAEITQPDDYYNANAKYEKQGKFSRKIREQMGEKQDFSLQLLEDKASNGYMQLMTALVLKKPEITRRFVSDKLYEKIEQQIKSEPVFVFNRLYLNHVTSFDFFTENGKDNIVVALKRSSQKIKNTNSNSPQFDRSIFAQDEVLIMSRDAGAGKPLGSLYAHSCPNCGAPVKDTVDLKCTYCDAQLNSTKYEWIISDWMSASEYTQYKQAAGATFVIDKKVDDLDELFKVRDYALNNVLMMVAADGRISEEELQYVNSLAKKWNYDLNKIQGFLMLAKMNKLVVRMPQDTKQKQKIIALMEKAATLDNTITPEEQALLEQVKNI
ncbi:MAG TPA: TIM44-like domain-containing protein [Chitinophagales bacterium]|nr:TIM44-like domain-containing protein [Chitinophagales bacterium]